MEAERLVLFCWGVSSYYGWGVYGLNLMLSWAGEPDLQAASLQQLAPDQLDLDPLELHALTPALRRSAELQDGIRPLAGGAVTSAHLVLQSLHNGYVRGRAAHDVAVTGSPQVAVAFLDDTTIGPGVREVLREHAFVVAGSRWNQDLLEEAGAPRVECVLQAVDSAYFHPAPRRGLLGDRFVVFSGGKLEFRKGQDLVLRAFRIFSARHPDAVLMTSWSSPWPGLAASIAEAGAVAPPPFLPDGRADIPGWAARNGIDPGQVIDVGLMPNRAMPRVMREADIAVFASRAEGGTNLVAMECMGCGVPTALSANTGHLDLLDAEAGIPLTRQRKLRGAHRRGWGESDVDEIVAVLEDAYTDREAARAQGARGAAFMQDLSWSRQMGRLGDLVRPLL
jgi:glycosyltransferase involved in cell wall biosynthesis